MKIGDEVYVHGYIDEIRKDTVIIRNDGGYFGTAPSEVAEQEPSCRNTRQVDLISRQSAIDAMVRRHNNLQSRLFYDLANGVGEAIEVIKGLPSAPSVVPSKEGSEQMHFSEQDRIEQDDDTQWVKKEHV